MPYSLIYSPRAQKDFTSIPASDQTRIIKKLESLVNDPFSHIRRLKKYPLFSLRVGDYRVILDVQRNRVLIIVLTAGHRKNVSDKI